MSGVTKALIEIMLTDINDYKGKYYCPNCAVILEEDEFKTDRQYVGECWGTPAYEDWSVCPYCGESDFEDIIDTPERLVDGRFENAFTIDALVDSEKFTINSLEKWREKIEGMHKEIVRFADKVGLDVDTALDDFIDAFVLAYSKVEKDSCLYLVDCDEIVAGYTREQIKTMGYGQIAEFMYEYTKNKGIM